MDVKVKDKALLELKDKAEEVSRLLSALAHPKRLIVLCNLVDAERSVGQLADMAGLGQAALSQHLSKLRDLRLVDTRRQGQTIYYRLASTEVRAVLNTLYQLYCAP